MGLLESDAAMIGVVGLFDQVERISPGRMAAEAGVGALGKGKAGARGSGRDGMVWVGRYTGEGYLLGR